MIIYFSIKSCDLIAYTADWLFLIGISSFAGTVIYFPVHLTLLPDILLDSFLRLYESSITDFSQI